MSLDLQSQLAAYGKYHREAQPPLERDEFVSMITGPVMKIDDRATAFPVEAPFEPEPPPLRSRWLAAAAAVAILLLVGGAAWVSRQQGAVDPAEQTTVPVEPLPDPGESQPSGGTVLPDFAAAVPGDDGAGPSPIGTVTELSDSVRLDFLFEFCGWYGPECFRDAHFVDPDNPQLGAGGFTAGRPFHVRHGFINNGEAPLGDGFDVVVYVTPLDVPSEFGGVPAGETVRYTSDYVIRGETDRCGPTYKKQTGIETCEWFVHEFPDGLPEGRFAIWAVWEAQCSYWAELAFTDACSDPSLVMSVFSSGFDGPFGSYEPLFDEQSQVGLSQEEAAELFGDAGGPIGGGFEPGPVLQPPVDASGASPTGGTPRPDYEGAVAGDDGAAPLPLGAVGELPASERLDFLFEFCGWYTEDCFRDAHFMDPGNPGFGSGPWPAGRPFHIRHGFVNNGQAPLGEGFDVVVYVTAMDDAPSEFGGVPAGTTVRYSSDYVLRGTTDQCGPTYRTQSGPETCEWFVHDFPDGLPAGRHAIWAEWEASCSAWLEMGFTDSCADPDEVTSMFASGVDSPFDASTPSFTEANEAPGA